MTVNFGALRFNTTEVCPALKPFAVSATVTYPVGNAKVLVTSDVVCVAVVTPLPVLASTKLTVKTFSVSLGWVVLLESPVSPVLFDDELPVLDEDEVEDEELLVLSLGELLVVVELELLVALELAVVELLAAVLEVCGVFATC